MEENFAIGEEVIVYSRFSPFRAKILEVKPKRVKVQFEKDGRIRWRYKSEVRKIEVK